MNKRIIYFLVSIILVIVSIIIQSVIFPLFFKNDYMPDIPLIALIYFSINYGKNIGQVLGFVSGIVMDSLSGVPFGLNTIVRLVMGFFLGFFEGKIFLDNIVLPCVTITVCTILKYILFFITSLIFPIDININYFTIRLLVELGLNIVFTPFIFILFNILRKKINPNRETI